MEPTIFKAVEEAIFEAVRLNGNAYWHDLQAARILIGDSYSDQSLSTDNATCLPFTFEALRLAYAHLYYTAHAHMVKEFLGRFWTSKKAFRTWCSQLANGQLRLCCVGGGPGSDILGLALFIQNNELNVSGIQGDVLERWSEWRETFKTLTRHLHWQSDTLPANSINVTYWEFDFHKLWDKQSEMSQHMNRLRQANLVTMVKFVSAVAADRDLCQRKLTILLQAMKEGALLFFLDNAGGGYARLVYQAATTAGLYQIGKFEHEDVSLPEEEAMCISSSHLRLAKIKSEKTWKISVSLWRKGSGQICGKNLANRSKQTLSASQLQASQSNFHTPQSFQRSITPQPINLNSHVNQPALPQAANRNISQPRYLQPSLNNEDLDHIYYETLASQSYVTQQQHRSSSQHSTPTHSNFNQVRTSQPYANSPLAQVHQPGVRPQHRYAVTQQHPSPTTAVPPRSVVVSQPTRRQAYSTASSSSAGQSAAEEEEGCCFCCPN